jgi:hypothetical protein
VSGSGVKSWTERAEKTRTPVNGDGALHEPQTEPTYRIPATRLVARTGDATSNKPSRSFASAGRPKTRRMAGKARNKNAATREANSNQPPAGSPAQYAREDSATAWVRTRGATRGPRPEGRAEQENAPALGESSGGSDNELTDTTDDGRTAARRSALGIVCSLVSRTIPPARPSKPG